MFYQLKSRLFVAAVSAIVALQTSGAWAGCPSCGAQPAPPPVPAAHRCPTCGQFVQSASPWSGSYGWNAPRAPYPYVNYGYYAPRYPGYSGYASPWVLNRHALNDPVHYPTAHVPAPMPDPYFSDGIAAPLQGYYGSWTAIPHSADYDPYYYGSVAGSPWVRERYSESLRHAWDNSARYPSAAAVWQSYH